MSTLDLDSVEGLLTLWRARRSAAEGDPPPLHLVVYGSDAALDAHAAVWETLRPQLASLDLRVLSDGPLPRLAAQIVTHPGVNLLQGDFARRSTLGAHWPAWRLTAILLGAWFIVSTVADWASLRQLRGEIAAVDQSIDQAFHYVFPDAGPITDPRAQLSAQLQRLGGASSGGSQEFLDMLRALSQAMTGTTGIRLEALNYRAGSLELRLKAPSVDVLDKVQQQLVQSGGLEAQIQSANPDESGVTGRLQIKRGAK